VKIYVYSSAAAFGGHELMALQGLTALLESGHQLFCRISACNTALIMHIRYLMEKYPGAVTLRLGRYHARSLQIVRTWLSWFQIFPLVKEINASGAQRVLVLQGDIEQASEGILAARLSRVKTVSYIPMVMSGRERSIRLPWVRDLLSKPLYRLVHRFIVISEYFERRLAEFGATEVVVVFNSIADEFFKTESGRLPKRQALGVRQGEFISGFLGRVSYQQKGLDRLLELLHVGRSFFSENRMLIVGDGPDRSRLEKDLHEKGLNHCVILSPWVTQERQVFYDAMDVFLCFSRFEGVPLSMLEATARSVPILSVSLTPLLGVLPAVFVGDAAEHFCPTQFLGHLEDVKKCERFCNPEDRRLLLEKIEPTRFARDFVMAVVA
jgi:glycosyltransferase involved in cell wall biosynthesis